MRAAAGEGSGEGGQGREVAVGRGGGGGEALLDGLVAPLGRVLLHHLAAARVLALLLLLGKLEQPLDVAAVGRLVEDHLLAVLAHRLRDVLVDGHRARVDDAKVHPVLDAVVQEDCVHRLTQRREPAWVRTPT